MTAEQDTPGQTAANNNNAMDAKVDEEESKCPVDPFTHAIRLTPLQWLRTALFAVFVFPVRLVLLLVVTTLSWALSALALRGLDADTIANKPLASLEGWRFFLQKASNALGLTACYISGFWITVRGRMASTDEAPILVVAPHSTFFDGMASFVSGGTYMVSRLENKAIPLLGKNIECAQALFVSREDPLSRQKTVAEIIRRSASSDPWPHLLIFPEGSTSNRQALMTFKPGAFYPGKPVQPVVMRYGNKTDTVTWTWNQSHGALMVLFLTLSQPWTNAELEYLPVYYPSDAEIADPKLYAGNVRTVMASALGVPVSDMTFEEVKSLYGKKKRKRTKSKNE